MPLLFLSMRRRHCAAVAATLIAAASAQAQNDEVIHWWTAPGEVAAVRQLAQAVRDAGGVWKDTAIAGPEQARSVAVSRIVGGKPPLAAQFNLSRQFQDLTEQGLLHPLDAVAARGQWDRVLVAPLRDLVRQDGHYYAVPVGIHAPTWIWYSKSALKKAGVAAEPASLDEFFAALDKLRTAGLIPLAHGGQAWQDMILFNAMLANAGGSDLYARVVRQRDPAAIRSAQFRDVLLAFRRLKRYVDPASPGRNWNDTTALLISDRAGFQIMGDWVKSEFRLADRQPGRNYGCIPALGPSSPYPIEGDVLIFPRGRSEADTRAQDVMAAAIMVPATQLAFSQRKGSLPARTDIDASQLDACARLGMKLLTTDRAVGSFDAYLTPDESGALTDVITAYWNDRGNRITAEKVQADILRILRNG